MVPLHQNQSFGPLLFPPQNLLICSFYLKFIQNQRDENQQSLVHARLVELFEADIVGVLPEALTTHVQMVLPDETVSVGASAATPRALSVLAEARKPDIVVTHCQSEMYQTIAT